MGLFTKKVITKALTWARKIAADNTHGYDQNKRWSKIDYDCSSFVISAYEQAGVPVRSKFGADTTSNIYDAFIKAGFSDVSKKVNRSSGSGLQPGDVVLDPGHHVAMSVTDKVLVHASINEKGKIVGGKAGDQTGRELCERSFYAHPWKYVLRYTK